MKNEHKNLISQAEELAEVLTQKGYDGIFQFRPSKMIAGLAYGMKGLATIWKFSDVKEIPDLQLSTVTHSDEKRNLITCVFDVRYDQLKGFKIKEMEILNQNVKGLTIDFNHIEVQNHEDLPSKVEANRCVTPPSLIEKLVNKKGIKF